YRRKYGASQPEVCLPSRFLYEVPPSLRERLSPYKEPHAEEVDLFLEQHDVRESVKRNLYTGRTYNSVENIAQFFADRGMPPPSGFTRRPQTASTNASTVASNATGPPQPRTPQSSSRPGSAFRSAAPRRTLGF